MKPLFRMKEKRAILFDLQHTLLDPGAARIDALTEAIEEFTGRWLTDEELAASGWSPQQSAQRYADLVKGAKRSAAERMEALGVALSPSPFPVTQPFLTRVWQRTLELTPLHMRPYPNAADTLERLQRNYKLAIVTNGEPQAVLLALHASGLNRLFPDDHVFATADRGKKKPDRELFLQAVKRLGVRPSQAVMVGNSWKSDVRGAAASGIDAIWIRRRLPATKKTARRKIGRTRLILISRIAVLQAVFEGSPPPD